MVEPAPRREAGDTPTAGALWAEVLRRVTGDDGGSLSAALGAVEPLAVEGGRLRLSVGSPFHRDRLLSRYLPSIRQALRDLQPGLAVEVVVRDEPPPAPTPPVDQLSLTLDGPPPGPAGPAPADDGGFDARRTFETFVVGPSNRLARTAAMCVAEGAPNAYNPLFIHGESGNGKTHLLQAIGQHVRRHAPGVPVRYITSERFTREFIEGVKENKLEVFKRRYRTCSLLLVDDVQFLEGKEGTQEEFFHTFEDVVAAGSRIVLSADRHPGDIPSLPHRLRSRFMSGLVADLHAPEPETRLAILRSKAAATGAELPDDILEMLASAVTTNVRELEGALVRVLAEASLEGRPLTLEAARRSLQGYLGSAARVLSLKRIIEEATEVFDVAVEDLCGHSRTRSLVSARQATMYVCRCLTEDSLPAIGKAFGKRDHTTVLHAVRKVEKLMSERNAVYTQVVELMARLGAGPPQPH